MQSDSKILHEFRMSKGIRQTTIIVIALVALIALGLILMSIFLMVGLEPWGHWLNGGLIVLIILPLYVAYLYRPRFIIADNQNITVRLEWKRKIIRIDEISSIEKLGKNTVVSAWRTGGSGGFYGFYGNFWSGKIGKFKMHITSYDDHLILITLNDGKKIVVNCDEQKITAHIREVKTKNQII